MAEPEGGYHGTCDWGYCDRPANAMRQMDEGDWLPVCDEHSIPGEALTETRAALATAAARVEVLTTALEGVVASLSFRPYKTLVDDSCKAYGIALDALRDLSAALAREGQGDA